MTVQIKVPSSPGALPQSGAKGESRVQRNSLGGEEAAVNVMRIHHSHFPRVGSQKTGTLYGTGGQEAV